MIARPPSSIAEKVARAPESFPIGVRAPETISEAAMATSNTSGAGNAPSI